MSEFVYPSEVFAAIAEAKRRNPKDELGMAALEFKIDVLRQAKNGVRYFSVNILKRTSNGWEYVPLIVKLMNTCTVANIQPVGSEKKKFAAVSLTFKRSSAKFVRTVAGQPIDECYGDAIVAIYDIFEAAMKRFKKTTKIHLANKIIRSAVQKSYKDSKTETLMPINPEDYLIRVELPFNYTGEGNSRYIKSDEPPKCDIYDVTRKEPKPKPGDLPFAKNTYKNGLKTESLRYNNIHEFIKCGSSLSGLNDMSSGCLSSQGISLPSKITLLMVKPSQGRRPEAVKVFDASEFESISDAQTLEDPEVAETEDNPEKEADLDINNLTTAASELSSDEDMIE
jgi:hypothetical protein